MTSRTYDIMEVVQAQILPTDVGVVDGGKLPFVTCHNVPT